MESKAWKLLLTEKNPEEVFDLVCAGMWFAGNLDQNIPVDDAREVFAHIKQLIIKQVSGKTAKKKK